MWWKFDGDVDDYDQDVEWRRRWWIMTYDNMYDPCDDLDNDE